jgi:hypothetical protein
LQGCPLRRPFASAVLFRYAKVQSAIVDRASVFGLRMIFPESRCTLCANAALRVRMML